MSKAKYDVRVYRRDGREPGYAKYKVVVNNHGFGDNYWEDFTYMMFRWNAKKVAREIIKQKEPKPKKGDVLVREFSL